MDDNELLKNKFQQLHTELVGQDLSAVADRLFAARIISEENMEDLSLWGGSGGCWSSAKSRRLMTLLHRSHHPRAFTELRCALCELDSIKWIVEKLDQLDVDDRLTHKVTESAHCLCPNCGHSHQFASVAAGQAKLIT